MKSIILSEFEVLSEEDCDCIIFLLRFGIDVVPYFNNFSLLFIFFTGLWNLVN